MAFKRQSKIADAIVVGGGVVGAAIGYGLAKHGMRPIIFDGGDQAIRASRVNFGLVWILDKGDGMPAYGFWTKQSIELWTSFSDELKSLTGINTQYVKSGGLSYCLSEAEYNKKAEMLNRMCNQSDTNPYESRMIDRLELKHLMPSIQLGPDVIGAAYGPHDGHVSPLNLLHALHAGLNQLKADYRPNCPVTKITPLEGGFEIQTSEETVFTPKVILAAGHGITPLMKPLGFDIEIIAERGQIMVTERVKPIGLLPGNGVRQTAEGTILIGSTNEMVGFDVSTTAEAGASMVSRALRVLPSLSDLQINRTWAGIRTLTQDDCPVYEQSKLYPGAFLATCHSGVTLAAVHAEKLATAIFNGALNDDITLFHSDRFKKNKSSHQIKEPH